ncbi:MULTISPECIES: ribonuclease HII [unclassified Wenzhouxiangella]|uniref:ribonuclease HII n=1 Tax=unclassified Wenzhouxiangella TaxID=2613841 RepID=UPI000E32AD3E|nr:MULTISPECIES: ribonuclease HII [unclassified Wenzhouxiangella]RFF27103.1 ribonuclease HII [Wenzhouxiangella sp. 15181]RFP69211.1 ribonuclease HII [Wenzhouxiangella sp. 15190]
MTTADVCTGPIAGVDEAGRGPLAGPVVAAAVVLDPRRPITGLADSKQLSAARREKLADSVRQRAVAWGLAVVEPGEIDRLNILQATLQAMREALEALALDPVLVRIDGDRSPRLPWPVQTVIGGDRLDRAISAASILAKVHRDALMLELHEQWPHYGFDRHKGYATAAHLAALEIHGPCPAHRRSFRPVHQASLF